MTFAGVHITQIDFSRGPRTLCISQTRFPVGCSSRLCRRRLKKFYLYPEECERRFHFFLPSLRPLVFVVFGASDYLGRKEIARLKLDFEETTLTNIKIGDAEAPVLTISLVPVDANYPRMVKLQLTEVSCDSRYLSYLRRI